MSLGDCDLAALPDACVALHRGFFAAADADRLLAAVLREVRWQQQHVRLFGRSFAQPRLTAWHGEPHAVYSYSGLRLTPAPWTSALLEIRDRIAAHTGWALDGVLLNLYRDGRDSMGWHADDEPELGPEPRIASASLGETRRFAMRRRGGGKPRLALDLDHGSLLLMSGPTQAHWQHAVPKTTQQVGVRVNLTFRTMAGAER